MGCGSSMPVGPGKIDPVRIKHPLVTENAQPIQRIRAHEAIKKNDSFLVNKALADVEPTENLGLPGDNYTCLHAAAHHNSFQAMDAMINWIKNNREADLNEIMNIPTAEGVTVPVMCIIHDASETFYMLLQANVVDLTYKNKAGQDLRDLARRHSFYCLEVLKRATRRDSIQQEKPKPKPEPQPQPQVPEQQNEQVPVPVPKKDDLAFKKQMTRLKINVMVSKITKIRRLAKKYRKLRQSREETDVSEVVDPILQGVPQDSELYTLLTDLMNGDKAWKDPNFATSIQSITNDKKNSHFAVFQKASWKRPHELFSCDYDEIQLFDSIDPNDISQGLLGVCYLLSSLSAMAEYPSRLNQIYLNDNSNKYGVYAMKIYVQGVPQELIVDDYFPCYGDRKIPTPLFSKPKGKELWVLLAEKVWAKMYKNYIACEAGFMDEALEYLLGTPASRHVTENQEISEIWNILSEADKNKYILCAGTNGQVTEEMGLVANHAYSIISLHQDAKYQIVKLRNPWGKFEWKGDFSDDSPLWNEELKTKVGYTHADDGLFCMTIQDFKKCFEFYSIGVYHEGWEYTYIESECTKDHAEYFTFTVTDPCEIYLRIHQSDKRNLPESEQDAFKYSSGDLILARAKQDGTYSPVLTDVKNIHSGTFWGARSIYPSKQMKLDITQPGDYVIRTKMRWRYGTSGKYTLSAYAPFKIEMEKTEPIKDFLPQLLRNIAKKAEQKPMGDGCTMASAFYSYYLYVYLNNPTKKKWVIDIDFTKLQNLKLSKGWKQGEKKFHIEVGPQQSEIAILKKIDVTGGASYGWQFEHILE